MADPNVPKLPDGMSSRLERLRALCVRAFGENGDLKVLSVVLAALLFLLIRQPAIDSRYSTKTFTVPVRVVSSNPYVTVVDYAPLATSVTLRGPRNVMDPLNTSRLALEIRENFPDREGTVFRPLGGGKLLGAEEVRLLSPPEGEARVELDYTVKWETSNLVALPALVGRPVEGGTATVRLDDPLVVVAKGSFRKINEFRDAGLPFPTEPIDVEGKTKSFSVPVAIKIPADSGISSIEPGVVTAYVDIAVSVSNRTETSAPVLLKDVEPAAAPAAEPGKPAEEPGEEPAGPGPEAPAEGGAEPEPAAEPLEPDPADGP